MLYLAFCSRMRIQPYQAVYQDVCAFLEYMAHFIPAPATIKNKLSHVRTHMVLVEESMQVFSHPRVLRALDAMERRKEYVPRAKEAIPPAVLAHILHRLGNTPMLCIIRSIFLTMYYGALRQSELLPNSINSWSSLKQPTRGDLQLQPASCSLFIKFGKNMQKTGQNRHVCLLPAEDQALCPVHAMTVVVSITPTRSQLDPLYMFPSSRKPIPISYVRKEFSRGPARWRQWYNMC